LVTFRSLNAGDIKLNLKGKATGIGKARGTGRCANANGTGGNAKGPQETLKEKF